MSYRKCRPLFAQPISMLVPSMMAFHHTRASRKCFSIFLVKNVSWTMEFEIYGLLQIWHLFMNYCCVLTQFSYTPIYWPHATLEHFMQFVLRHLAMVLILNHVQCAPASFFYVRANISDSTSQRNTVVQNIWIMYRQSVRSDTHQNCVYSNKSMCAYS